METATEHSNGLEMAADSDQAAVGGSVPEAVGRPIVFLDDNEIFIRYVRAVAAVAKADVVALTCSRRLPAVLERHRPGTVITDLHMPCRDAIELLPLLKASGTVRHLVIVSGVQSPVLTTAARLARVWHSWTVETWTKPIRTAFLSDQLVAFSGRQSDNATPTPS